MCAGDCMLPTASAHCIVYDTFFRIILSASGNAGALKNHSDDCSDIAVMLYELDIVPAHEKRVIFVARCQHLS